MPLSKEEVERIQEFERVGAMESQKRQAEWEAQTGNPYFQKASIEVFELKNTFGCAWRHMGGDEIHYGFKELPPNCQLWLGIASGDAVQRIIEADIGRLIGSEKGSYGGVVCTVLVDIDKLEAACLLYWERTNAREVATDRSRCHYCGMEVAGRGFFGEPACPECGG